ncbi:trypsin-like peptidase domain-containing protein [Streptomyces sudanensis]|uniref:trypsin-like peptidase domain-containing protein n=1 Tax=Streptomyces sudanensis TaxID=436397 RepID=UPI0020CDC76A|nr:trypsin-like peptidase domain-containing protein [Streptomyces sudanensis]MCQ0002130.1 trypsin-like peptidase domain-containing protein [Streptomyces sudanensis]
MVADGGISADPSSKTPPWAVRIRWGNGEIAGAGVLLSPDRVLTCAHVVDPGAHVTAEFVGAPGRDVPAVTAWVDEGAHVPETRDADGDPSGDVALLRLERPRPAHEAVFLHRLSAPNRTVRMYGFPHEHNGGIWFRATIIGGCGRDGQVQLGPQTPGELASPGCSGAGVVDDLTGAVIGIVLTGMQDRHGNAFSFMSPAETIVQHLPRVAEWTRGRTAVDDRLRSRVVGGLPARDLDEPFAQRLAAWFRGDGAQVKISLVRPGDHTRAATLRRAITLADRELRTAASVGRASHDPPGTVPSAGGHDLALDVTGVTAAETAERVAERMGLWQHPADPAVERIRTGGVALTLVVVGVDRAVDPPALLDLLTVLAKGGSRLLLVFHETGPCYERARSDLLVRPARERRDRLVARLGEITGPLAASLGEAMAAVRADDPDSVHDALYRAGGALHLLAGAEPSAAPGEGPDLAAFERLADRLDARLRAAAERLDALRRRRGELAGRLDAYHALHRSLTEGAEDLETDNLYRHAHRLLRARPCDVPAAEEAVDGYVRLVERADRSGRARDPRERGGAAPS